MARLRIAAAFFLSGMAALIYQVIWQRLLFVVVGVDLESVSIVVSTFMMGLGLGALIWGWLADRMPERILLTFCAVEAGIAVFGLLSVDLILGLGTTFAGFPNSTTCVRLIATTANSLAEGDICVVTGGPTPLTAPSLSTPTADQRFARGAPVTFDWSDVNGAATYEIQVDDRDTFSAPLVLDQTSTVSRISSTALPTGKMFWRARAISASGSVGPWSATRRLEIK